MRLTGITIEGVTRILRLACVTLPRRFIYTARPPILTITKNNVAGWSNHIQRSAFADLPTADIKNEGIKVLPTADIKNEGIKVIADPTQEGLTDCTTHIINHYTLLSSS
jgi:hypothetical protein